MNNDQYMEWLQRIKDAQSKGMLDAAQVLNLHIALTVLQYTESAEATGKKIDRQWLEDQIATELAR